jgi:hypothetical protein
MTNTSQTNRFQEQTHGEMNVMNHDLVRDHIDDLLREGAAMRAERSEAEHRHETQLHAATRAAAPSAIRVRLGRWLVGIGWAVAGSTTESHGTAHRAA